MKSNLNAFKTAVVLTMLLFLVEVCYAAYTNPGGTSPINTKLVKQGYGYHELRLVINGSEGYSVDANENGIIDVAETVLNGGGGASLPTCSDNEILRYSAGFWICSKETWAKSVHDIYYDSGKVGIGSTPSTSYNSNLDLYKSNDVSQLIRTDNALMRLVIDGGISYLQFGIPGGIGSSLKITSPGVGQEYMIINGTTGNVGIGTTNPSSPLHIERISNNIDGTGVGKMGSVRLGVGILNSFERRYTSIGHNLYHDGTNFRYYGDGVATLLLMGRGVGSASPTDSDFVFYTFPPGAKDAVATQKEVMRIKEDGKVGIGTKTPQAKLDIASNISQWLLKITSVADAAIIFQNAESSGMINYDRTSNGFEFRTAGTDEESTKMYIGYGGNVGIGTKTPNQKLYVMGNIKSNGTICDGNNNCIGAGGADSDWIINGNNMSSGVSGNVGIGTNSPVTKLHIVGSNAAIQIDNTAVVPGSGASFWVDQDGNLVLSAKAKSYDRKDLILDQDSGNLGIGTINPISKIHVVGNGASASGPSNSRVIIENTDNNNQFYLNTWSGPADKFSMGKVGVLPVPFTIEGNGNIGIGTATPTHRLNVVGDASVFGSNANQNILTIRRTTGQVGNIFQWQQENGQNLGVIDEAGRLGVGAMDPIRLLEINSSTSDIARFRTALGSGNYIDIGYDSGDDQMRISTDQTSGIGFRTTSSATNDNVVIDSQGRFGVGTNSPIANVHVHNPAGASSIIVTAANGVTSMSQIALMTNYANLANLWSSQNRGWAIFGRNNQFTGGAPTDERSDLGFSYWDGSNWRADLWIDSATGNVGIGTNNPASQLEVNGDVKATAFYYSSDERLKRDIVPIDSTKISELNPVSFKWKSDGKESLGLIAQELEKVYPELVLTSPDGYKSVDYAGLIAPLIKTVQQQQMEIDELRAEIEELKK